MQHRPFEAANREQAGPLGRVLRQVRQPRGLSALFFALTGTAVAARPLITGADVADDSLTGADVVESSLATVPFANDTNNFGGLNQHRFVTHLWTSMMPGTPQAGSSTSRRRSTRRRPL